MNTIHYTLWKGGGGGALARSFAPLLVSFKCKFSLSSFSSLARGKTRAYILVRPKSLFAALLGEERERKKERKGAQLELTSFSFANLLSWRRKEEGRTEARSPGCVTCREKGKVAEDNTSTF